MKDVHVAIDGRKYLPMTIYMDSDGIPSIEGIGEIPNPLEAYGLRILNKTVQDHKHSYGHIAIKNVIFNPPATIVFWSDGTKSVVKAQNGEKFDPEKGLAMAIIKRIKGNKGNYYNVFAKWCKNYKIEEKEPKKVNMDSLDLIIAKAFSNLPSIGY